MNAAHLTTARSVSSGLRRPARRHGPCAATRQARPAPHGAGRVSQTDRLCRIIARCGDVGFRSWRSWPSGCVVLDAQSPPPALYYPGREWRTATPGVAGPRLGGAGRSDRAGPRPATRRAQPAGHPARLPGRRRRLLPVSVDRAARHRLRHQDAHLDADRRGGGQWRADARSAGLVLLPDRMARRRRRTESARSPCAICSTCNRVSTAASCPASRSWSR